MHRLLATVTCIAAATAAAADPVPLSDDALKTTFTGSLVEMDTPAGTVIPVRFSSDGLVSGTAGVLASVLGAARDRGRWWIADDKLCTKWFRWFEARPRCVSIHLDGTRIYWRGEERNGTGTITEFGTVARASATARPKMGEPAKIELADTAPVSERPTPAPKVLADAADDAVREEPKLELIERQVVASSIADAPQAPMTARQEAEKLAAKMAAAAGQTAEPPVRDSRPIQFAAAALGATFSVAAPATPSDATRAATPPPPAKPKPPVELAAVHKEKALRKDRTQASSAVFTPSFRVSRVDAGDVLNVRSGPSEDYAAVGGLPPQGRGVKIVGPCRDDWCPIRYGQVTGWVNRYFLAEETPPGTATTALSR
jgi:Bacterial SH3 domain